MDDEELKRNKKVWADFMKWYTAYIEKNDEVFMLDVLRIIAHQAFQGIIITVGDGVPNGSRLSTDEEILPYRRDRNKFMSMYFMQHKHLNPMQFLSQEFDEVMADFVTLIESANFAEKRGEYTTFPVKGFLDMKRAKQSNAVIYRGDKKKK